MANPYRENYLQLAHSASENAEPTPAQSGPDWSEDFPLDVPDDSSIWDWPDAPDPRVNDINRHFAWGWMTICAAISLASLAYLIRQSL